MKLCTPVQEGCGYKDTLGAHRYFAPSAKYFTVCITYQLPRVIDVAISGDRNVIKNETEKILKYKDLTTEIQRIRNVKTKVILVIIGATGTISKTFRKYVSNIPGKYEGKELQKTAILGTAHIIWKVLM